MRCNTPGLELYIGLRDEVSTERIATFVGGSRLGMALHGREVPWPVLRRMMNPRSMTFKAFTNLHFSLDQPAEQDKRPSVVADACPHFFVVSWVGVGLAATHNDAPGPVGDAEFAGTGPAGTVAVIRT